MNGTVFIVGIRFAYCLSVSMRSGLPQWQHLPLGYKMHLKGEKGMLHYHPLGDQGIQIVFSDQTESTVIRQIRSLMNLLDDQNHLPVIECVPAYTTLSIYYDAMKINYNEVVNQLRQLTSKLTEVDQMDCYVVEIPICYGGDYGPDLEDVASHSQLTNEEVISIHTSKPYLIFMLGFSPGFPYLGGMSEKIATPRLSTPRTRVPGGSVGIAGGQTGVYPMESPGGWRIIGRTPLRLYDPDAKQPILLQAGDYIRFVSIDQETFTDLENRISNKQPIEIKRVSYTQKTNRGE